MSSPDTRLQIFALIGAIVPTLALMVLTLIKTGGVWEYALDDVYIHLAMSEQVAVGSYGVNAGESASASSSVLYSYMLAPFAGFGWHQYWPLVLGWGALIGAAMVWARVLQSGLNAKNPLWNNMLLVLALIGPLFLHMPALALIGMEHMLHVLASLGVALGLIRFAQGGGISWFLVLGIVANPILRFEGMALAILACGVLFFGGRKLAGLGILALTALPLSAHFAYMASLGLDMLPNSVNAKAAIVGGAADVIAGVSENDRLRTMMISWLLAFAQPTGRMLMAVVLVFGVCMILLRRHFSGVQQLMGWAVVFAAFAHVTLGSVAPFFRYEPYVWGFAGAIGVYLLGQMPMDSVRARQAIVMFPITAFVIGGLHYPVDAFVRVPSGGAAIHAQQRQMGLFVDRHWKAPIAVNDLGHVAYDNPHYVLDLWGLASADALAARSSRSDMLWADKLAKRYNVRAAMVYRHWLAAHIPDSWTIVARLKLTIPVGTLGGNIVTFYAIDPSAIDNLREKLKAFEPELPHSAVLEFES